MRHHVWGCVVRVFLTCLAAIVLSMVSVAGSAAAPAQSGPNLPPGFRANVYVNGLSNPTAMSFGPDKRLYVSQLDGTILAIGNRRVVTVASGFNTPLGIGWNRGLLYVSSTGKVTTLRPDRTYAHFARRDIITGIPTGRHQNDGMVFSHGWMYLGVGSTCDACVETDRRSATIMRFYLDGSHAQVYARGMRNPYGLALQRGSGALYVTDNGRDDHDDQVPDELNRVVQGGNYGFPDCWGRGGGTHCGGTIAPVALLPPHSSADGIAFYSGRTFPSRYRGDAFVAEYGATVGARATGHVVQDAHFAGGRVTVTDFATGLSHPLAVTPARDGSLLIADWGTGTIWHVQYGR